jgi:exopolysaccharide biosynthesis predicted pyruvyltransferase EpsI/GT2 family glycosyltransferase
MGADCLEKLVGFMKREPDLAMCFANIQVIDAEDNPIKENGWYPRGEQTGNVYLPKNTLRLNTYPENTIGAAFLYRKAVPFLIGGYDTSLYTVEDYDYWMRINDYLSIKHVDFSETVYQYRFHDNSLTSKAKELRINETRDKLLLMEDYREDWINRPICFSFDDAEQSHEYEELIKKTGNLCLTYEEIAKLCLPRIGASVVQITVDSSDVQNKPLPMLCEDGIRVLIQIGKQTRIDTSDFDLCIRIGDDNCSGNWISAQNKKAAIEIIQIFCKSRWFSELSSYSLKHTNYGKDATIVLCTYKRTEAAKQSLEAMLNQDYSGKYEILVINNDPENREMKDFTDGIDSTDRIAVRYLDCPYPGLSAARNFSLFSAEGEIVLYVDDDGIMANDCLRELISSFSLHPEADVIGGQILLNHPERFSSVILPGYESIWSEKKFEKDQYFNVKYDYDFPYGCNYAIRRSALRELGGFRVSYGRNGKDFSGGEEIVLSHLVWKNGRQIGINPSAVVIHDVDPSRYSLNHVKNTLRASRLTNRIMKMDLYKPYDLEMSEEKALLKMAESKMKQMRDENVDRTDLRYLYCVYDIDATTEAIRMGNRDIQLMAAVPIEEEPIEVNPADEEEKVVLSETANERTSNNTGETILVGPRRGRLNKIVCFIIRVFSGVFGKTKVGYRLRKLEASIMRDGLRKTWFDKAPHLRKYRYYLWQSIEENQKIADITRQYINDRFQETAVQTERMIREQSSALLNSNRITTIGFENVENRIRLVEEKQVVLSEAIDRLISRIEEDKKTHKNKRDDITESIGQIRSQIIQLNKDISEIINHLERSTANQVTLLNKSLSESMDHLDQTIAESISPIRTESKEINEGIVRNQNLIRDLKDYAYDIEQRSIRMQGLELINQLRQRKKILFVGTAEHKNIGDAAITLAEQKLFLEQFPDYYQVEVSTYEFAAKFSFLKAIENDDDLIVIHGGGNIGSLYREEEELHRKVIAAFPDKTILIMPQTVYFEDSKSGYKELELSKEIYNKHGKLKIYTRGETSLSVIHRFFPNVEAEVRPDSTIILNRTQESARKGILLCLRNDNESILTEADTNAVVTAVRKVDSEFETSDNMYDEDITRDIRSSVVEEELKRFASKKLVITDRLHGMLFSVITGTPVIVLKSCGYKIEEYYKEFFHDAKGIEFIGNDLSDIESRIVKMMNCTECNYPSHSVAAFYDLSQQLMFSEKG